MKTCVVKVSLHYKLFDFKMFILQTKAYFLVPLKS